MNMEMEAVCARDVLTQCMELAQPHATQQDIAIKLDAGGHESALLHADERRLSQVILNLITNAIKYNMSSGSVNIALTIPDETSARISISDSGPGIAPENQQRVFERFERLSETSATTDGAGIGLAVSKRLIELMGGSIGVISALGEGSTFWVELPIDCG